MVYFKSPAAPIRGFPIADWRRQEASPERFLHVMGPVLPGARRHERKVTPRYEARHTLTSRNWLGMVWGGWGWLVGWLRVPGVSMTRNKNGSMTPLFRAMTGFLYKSQGDSRQA